MRSRVTIDGLPLSYLSGGKGPTTLLLHTIGGSALEWTRITPILNEQLTTIALDLPGHGKSGLLDEHLPVPDIAALITKFLDLVGLERVNVVGSSMSGTNAPRVRHSQSRSHRPSSVGLRHRPLGRPAGTSR